KSPPRTWLIRSRKRDSGSLLAAIRNWPARRAQRPLAGQSTVSEKRRDRLFLDSNVLTAGIVSTWGVGQGHFVVVRVAAGIGVRSPERGGPPIVRSTSYGLSTALQKIG